VRIINGYLRSQISAKIKSAERNGTKANDPTIQEYQHPAELKVTPAL
jgi:hypothetical protein